MFSLRETKSLLNAVIGATCITGFATTSHAALYASESFDYTGTTLDGSNGGTGWVSGWSASTSTLSNDGTSLSYPNGISDSGDRISSIPRSETISRELSAPLDLSADGTFYYSFLANKQDAGSFDMFFSDGTNGRLKMRWGSSETVTFGVSSSGSVNVGTYATDTDLLFVFKVDTTSGNDTFSIKIYEPGDALVEPTSWDAVHTANTGITANSFKIVSNREGFQIDAIKIGSEFDDVVPEPGSLTLLSLGALAIFKRKSR